MKSSINKSLESSRIEKKAKFPSSEFEKCVRRKKWDDTLEILSNHFKGDSEFVARNIIMQHPFVKNINKLPLDIAEKAFCSLSETSAEFKSKILFTPKKGLISKILTTLSASDAKDLILALAKYDLLPTDKQFFNIIKPIFSQSIDCIETFQESLPLIGELLNDEIMFYIHLRSPEILEEMSEEQLEKIPSKYHVLAEYTEEDSLLQQQFDCYDILTNEYTSLSELSNYVEKFVKSGVKIKLYQDTLLMVATKCIEADLFSLIEQSILTLRESASQDKIVASSPLKTTRALLQELVSQNIEDVEGFMKSAFEKWLVDSDSYTRNQNIYKRIVAKNGHVVLISGDAFYDIDFSQDNITVQQVSLPEIDPKVLSTKTSNLISPAEFAYMNYLQNQDSDGFQEFAESKLFGENGVGKPVNKNIVPLFLEYYAKKGYDTTNSMVVPDCHKAISEQAIDKALNKIASGESFNIIYCDSGGHWTLHHYFKDKDLISSVIIFESLGLDSALHRKIHLDLLPDKIEAFYINSKKVQNSPFGCTLYSLKFLKYVLETGSDELIENVLKSAKKTALSKTYSFELPVECYKMTQSMTLVNKVNAPLTNKQKLKGKELENTIDLLEYVMTAREKGVVHSPIKNMLNGKVKYKNNVLDVFRAKYKDEAVKIILSSTPAELSDIYYGHSANGFLAGDSNNPDQDLVD